MATVKKHRKKLTLNPFPTPIPYNGISISATSLTLKLLVRARDFVSTPLVKV